MEWRWKGQACAKFLAEPLTLPFPLKRKSYAGQCRGPGKGSANIGSKNARRGPKRRGGLRNFDLTGELR
jgi:hypothetical protein